MWTARGWGGGGVARVGGGGGKGKGKGVVILKGGSHSLFSGEKQQYIFCFVL